MPEQPRILSDADIDAVDATATVPSDRNWVATVRHWQAEAQELRQWRAEVDCGRGCQCDPPGSGEEHCVGTCQARADLAAARLEIERLKRIETAARDLAHAYSADGSEREMQRAWPRVHAALAEPRGKAGEVKP